MRLLNRLNISTKVFSGFGIVLFLLLAIAMVSLVSLFNADRNFKSYRALARQTNAEGRVQANMLMTRLHAKDFIISANAENIEMIEERAQRTIEMIAEAGDLTSERGYQLLIDNLDQELHEYVDGFEQVTLEQARRDEIVHGTLNVVGPAIEKDLTAIMKSAFQDGDAEAAYWAGTTLRSLMLARLYANRFLIQNDDASFRRTPMNAILGYSEMLMEDAEDAGQEEIAADLQKIHQSGSHLLALVNDVLDLSKIESGKMEVLAEDFELEMLLDEVVATAQPLMGKNDNQLRIERGDDLGTAHQDLTKLRQSLLNLLSNAAKFTRAGTVIVAAERGVHQDEDWITLSVRDSGIGIPDDKLDRVFEEFGQADETTSREYGGTGLGLPVSRRFCQMLGGDLTVESRLGLGSTFTIRVPAQLPGTDAEVRKPAREEPTKTATELAAIRDRGEGRTVLVIDDDPEAREIIERLLGREDFLVVTAGTGAEGLRLAHALQPAVITLDVVMPDMDGWAVLRALKADPVLHDVPVVMLTMLDDKTRGYALGATDYLVKPVDRDALLRVLSRYSSPGGVCTALLVDDDAVVRKTVSQTLATLGWESVEAENGQAALEQMATCRPTLILLDLMMPVMDGFEFLVELHASPDWREIPVVVLTAQDLSAEDRRILSGRVEQIFEKDTWSHEQLVGLVEKLAARSEGMV